ncbi:unnamed protein product [Agarophyton chilense]
MSIMRLYSSLCVLGMVCQLANSNPHERLATPSDIEANWNLIELSGPDSTACPTTITHTSWMRLSPSVASLPHNTILVDQVRCDGQDKQPSFRMYLSTKYFKNLSAKDNADPLPGRMKQIIMTTGPNIAARTALLATGEPFLMGYESHQRWCKGTVFFANGTTSYLVRPFAPFRIPNVTTELIPGTKYLLMIPLFKATTCVYSARLRVAVEVPTTILPPETPEPEEETPGPVPPTEDSATDVTDQDENGEADGVANGSNGDDSGTEDDDNDVCFPASANVSLQDGSVLRISDLQLGDQVLVSRNTYSEVFAFSHRDKHVYTTFHTLQTMSGNAISATKGHFVYADHQLVPIETIKVGQMLHTISGFSPVTTISTERMTGLYNPQTEHGDIVVNGVIASTYTKSLEPSFAHAALTPLRAFSKISRWDILAALIDSGVKKLPGRSWMRVG